jgi:hypothetical protein
MDRVRTLSVGFILVAILTVACFAGAPTQPPQPTGKRVSDRLDPGEVYLVVYSVGDLPVWSRFPKEPHEQIDPSLLITHIQTVVAPDSWHNPSVQIRPQLRDATLLVIQNRKNHRLISELLAKLHAQADARVESWVDYHKPNPAASSAVPAR